MAIQKFRKVENYELLEKFFNKSILGFSIVWSKQMSRTYCKCGKVYVGEKEKCECGNPITEHFNFYYNYPQKYYSLYTTDKNGRPEKELNIYLEELKFVSIDSEKYLGIQVNKTNLFSIGEDYLIKGSKSLYGNLNYNSDFGKFFDSEIKKHPYYNSFKFWYEKMISNENERNLNCIGGALERIFGLNKNFPELMKDSKIYQYPYLTSEIVLSKISSEKNLEGLFNEKYGDEKYMESINYFLMQKKTTPNSYYYYCSSNSLLKNYITLNEFKKNKFKEYTNLLDLIDHYVLNHQLLITEASDLLDYLKSIVEKPSRPSKFPYNYKYFSGYYHKDKDPYLEDFFKIEYLNYFDTYLKENISLSEDKKSLIFDFIERIKDMKDAGIPIKRENFKIKNYNWLYTYEKMAETYKLPENKVSLFLDWFETNPLEALELVSNRRKLTNKQLDTIIDKLSK